MLVTMKYANIWKNYKRIWTLANKMVHYFFPLQVYLAEI